MRVSILSVALAATLWVAGPVAAQIPSGPPMGGYGPRGPMMAPRYGGPEAPAGYGGYAGPVGQAAFAGPMGPGGPMGAPGYGPPPGYAPPGYGPPPGQGGPYGVAPAGGMEGMPEGMVGEESESILAQPNDEACDCDICCYPRYPHWYLQVDALWLRWRESPARAIVIDQNTDDPVLRTNSGGGAFVVAPRATIGLPCGCYGSFEATYWGLHNFNGNRFVGEDGGNNLSLPPQIGPATLGFFNADTAQLNRSGRIHSAELNYFAPQTCRGVSWLTGLRYINLRDTFSLDMFDTDTAPNPPDRSFYNIETENNMVGAQIGLRYRQEIACVWRIDAVTKAGLMGVGAWHRTAMFDGVLGQDVGNRNFFERSVTTGGLLETNLNCTRWITNNLGVRFGGDLCYLMGVATTSKQLDFTDDPNSAQRLNRASPLFYGYHVGAESRW